MSRTIKRIVTRMNESFHTYEGSARKAAVAARGPPALLCKPLVASKEAALAAANRAAVAAE